jgi:hypothetical protein
MRSHGAPPEAQDALHFRHGVATWRFDEVVDAASRLITLAEQHTHWIDPDELRAGAVIAHVLRGDPAHAREVLRRLESVSTIGSEDLRARLLYAIVDRAEGQRSGPLAARSSETTHDAPPSGS